jgi:hypothetical protein
LKKEFGHPLDGPHKELFADLARFCARKGQSMDSREDLNLKGSQRWRPGDRTAAAGVANFSPDSAPSPTTFTALTL